jgi:hypothetical protein
VLELLDFRSLMPVCPLRSLEHYEKRSDDSLIY